MPETTAIALLDELISGWNDWDTYESYYLTSLAPAIVARGSAAPLSPAELTLVNKLQRLLSSEEWTELPRLIEARRARQLDQLESDRQRQVAREEAALAEAGRLDRARRAEQARIDAVRAEERARAAARASAEARVRAAFEANFINADLDWRSLAGSDLKFEDFEALKVRFVQDWAARELKENLDDEQARAVGALSGHVQVIARAGAGKTRTLVTRAAFLQKHCRIQADSILLLAFNRSAAAEMKKRLASIVGESLPHVMTFHALAHALVHPEESLLFDDLGSDSLALSREVQDVIDAHVRSDLSGGKVRELMLAHFREDWERIVNGRFELARDEFLAHRRALPRESLRGDYVKSFGEKLIANALFEHGVEYAYESNFRWDGTNYKPDFKIRGGSSGGVIIEYFGLVGDPEYDESVRAKRDFWRKRNEWKLIEIEPSDISSRGPDAFVRYLLQTLSDAGIMWRRLSDDEIWELVRHRALDRFTEAVKGFVARGRKRNLSGDELHNLIAAHSPASRVEGLFLEIVDSIYRSYVERLREQSLDDFDGLMWRAVAAIREGLTRFIRNKGREQGDLTRFKYVMVDEFQDFSSMFLEIIEAIRANNPAVQIFGVGDDWQAINGFAGSDLCFFERFSEYFQNAKCLTIRSNYRSAAAVVEAGNALMRGRGPAAVPVRAESGQVEICPMDEFTPTATESHRHGTDEITPATLRLVRRALDLGQNVVLLSRRKGLPWYVSYDKSNHVSDGIARFLEHLRSFLPEEDRVRVTMSTAHGFKGLEATSVIIVDAVEGSYPLIHPNWVFLRIFGDSLAGLVDEERRLFYVATTRAMKSVLFVTENTRRAPFIADMQKHCQMSSVSWSDLAPAASIDGARLEIRVFNAFETKDALRELKYRWNAQGKYWYRTTPAEGFSLASLRSQTWASGKVKIRVYSERGDLVYST